MFEDLEAWQQARHLVNEIYSLTRENSSLSKDFGLTGQVQRAAVSIMSNVAEGFERTHLPEKIQFYNIARGSTGEVRSLLYVISDNYPRSAPEAERLRSTAVSGWKAHLRPFAVDRGTESQTPTSAVASARPNLPSAGFYLPMTR